MLRNNRLYLLYSKLIATFLLLFFVSTYTQAQVPQTMSYQAVARDTEGFPVAEKDIVVEISIRAGSKTGSIVWQEVHYLTTNEFGMFALEIGGSDGVPTEKSRLGSFGEIDWSSNYFFVQTRVDFGAAIFINGFLEMGTVKLTSVPYSLVSDTALKVPIPTLNQVLGVTNTDLDNEMVPQWNGTNWVVNKVSTGVTGDFLSQDGTTDLTGDWTISGNNVSLGTGNLTLSQGKLIMPQGNIEMGSGTFSISDGDLSLTSGSLSLGQGSLSMTNGNLTLSNGLLTSQSLALAGKTITGISSDLATSATTNALATANAIKTYVDANAGVSYWLLNSSRIYNDSHFIGIGTSFPETRLHVNLQGDEALMVTGNFLDSGAIPNKGAGTRMVFYPIRSAFRAGTVSGTEWDNNSVGRYTVAFGKNTLASADFTFAHGENTTANGSYSAVFGASNTASGSKAFAAGKSNTAAGASSTVFGESNQANGGYSVALNYNNIAEGDNSIATGTGTATGSDAQASITMGFQTKTFGNYSVAMGEGTQTNMSGVGSFAGGFKSGTFGKYSLAYGDNANAVSYAEVAFGRYNSLDGAANMSAWDINDRLFVIGNGTGPTDRKNAFVVLKNGNVGIGVDVPGVALAVAGSITATGSITGSSDKRFKKDIHEINNALDKALQLNGVYYNWRTDEFPDKKFTERQQIGLIAQDVETIIPEVVETDNDGYKSVDYTKLTALLIEAIKEQQAVIETLKSENRDIKAQNVNQYEELNKRIDKLEELIKISAHK